MARPPATLPLALVLATTAVLATGCFDTSNTVSTVDYPTVLTVDPMLFRGTLRCGAPGLVSYVVTLIDVTSDSTSPPKTTVPVPCQSTVSFGDPPILSGHYYRTEIDGYDREVRETAADSRNMLDKSSGEPVSPMWRTNCGVVPPAAQAPDAEVVDAGDDARPYNPLLFPTLVIGSTEVIMHGCLPLEATVPPDASVGDGSSEGGGGLEDAAPPDDAGGETSDTTVPDGGDAGDDGGSDDDEGGDGNGGNDGGGDAG